MDFVVIIWIDRDLAYRSCHRSDCIKIQNALWKNAIGILVYNNDTEHPDDCSIRMATNYYQLPAAFISYNAAQKLAAKAGSF